MISTVRPTPTVIRRVKQVGVGDAAVAATADTVVSGKAADTSVEVGAVVIFRWAGIVPSGLN